MARGHIKQRSPGSHTIVLSLGTDPVTGKRRRPWSTFRGTKRQADAEMTRLLAEYDRGVVLTQGRLTVREYLENWLNDVVEGRNRPRTQAAYRSLVDNHIVPSCGAVQLAKLAPQDIDHMLALMREKGLTENTLRHAWVVLGKALKDAEMRGVVTRNVARLVDVPQVAAFEARPPDIRMAKKIFKEADAAGFGTVMRFLAWTGLRRGEAAALRWKNVDLERGVVEVVATAIRLPGRVELSDPKSLAGLRGVALDDVTIKILKSHRARQSEEILSLGGAYRDQGFVFAGDLGDVINPDKITREFRAAAKRAGAKRVRLHDLRHFHATELIRSGAHPKVVQDRLGHSSAAFTLQRYGHVSAELQAEAAEAFSKRFEAESG